MTRDPAVSINDLTAAYRAWPCPAYDKATLRALILRVRIERAIAALPATVISASADSTQVEQRLFLSLGDPNLTTEDQTRRLRIVLAARSTYTDICDLLHGRNPDPNPPLQDIEAWAASVNDLEDELTRRPRQPQAGRPRRTPPH
jgi:hypothetical protein